VKEERRRKKKTNGNINGAEERVLGKLRGKQSTERCKETGKEQQKCD
jgi:hypothetical protein